VETKAEKGRWSWIFRICGLFLLVIGIIGYVTPFLPGTFFMILATSCFAKSDERLEAWMLNNRWFGPTLTKWFADGSMSLKTKILSISMIVVAFGYSYFTLLTRSASPSRWLILAILLACQIALIYYLWTRPTHLPSAKNT